MKCVLKLISEKVLQSSDCKRLMGQILHTLLSEKGTDPSVLLCILDTVKSWIEDDLRHPASGTSSAALSPKEIVAYLQKLSLVDRKNFSPSTLEEWDSKYLLLLYGTCADSSRCAFFPLYSLNIDNETVLLASNFYLSADIRCPFVKKYSRKWKGCICLA